MTVQIFGLRNSQATRAAERFFKERGINYQFIDLAKKAMAPAEIRRFTTRYKLEDLLDRSSKEYIDAGLQYRKLTEAELLQQIERIPKLLRLPFIRSDKHLGVGLNEQVWKDIATTASQS